MNAVPGILTLSPELQIPAPTLESTDAAKAARGDARAFERLYFEHSGRILGLARRMMGPERADETVQDVFVRAWQKLGTFRGEAAFGTWLHRLAINLILSKRSALKIERDRFDPAEDALDAVPARRSGRELHMDFDTAIQELPPGARLVFVLHDVEGFKHEEIGKLLGVTAGTSKAQLHRARMMLRGVLAE